MSIAERLTEYLQANGLPVGDISIGTPTDRETWVIRLQTTATAQQIAALPALVAAFDPDTDVTEAEADRAEVAAAQAAQALTQIAARRQQITTDRTALASASTLAQVRPIVDRQLNAEDTTLAALARLVRALRWLV